MKLCQLCIYFSLHFLPVYSHVICLEETEAETQGCDHVKSRLHIHNKCNKWCWGSKSSWSTGALCSYVKYPPLLVCFLFLIKYIKYTPIESDKGGVHISKFPYGDLTWENQSVSKYNALWYVIGIGHCTQSTHILTCEDQSIVPYGQHLDWTLGKFPPIYGPHLSNLHLRVLSC